MIIIRLKNKRKNTQKNKIEGTIPHFYHNNFPYIKKQCIDFQYIENNLRKKYIIMSFDSKKVYFCVKFTQLKKKEK